MFHSFAPSLGNNKVQSVAHTAGWGVVAVMGTAPGDDDGLAAQQAVTELCGPVTIDPSDAHYFGATLCKYV
jgi:hypothetical protein